MLLRLTSQLCVCLEQKTSMIKSLTNLFKTPYNRRNPLSALFRFSYWKIIRLLRLKNLKYRLWDNKKLYLNYDSFQCMWVMYNNIVDWEEFNLIRDYIKPGDAVADVGSNMGYYTIWMSKFIGSEGKIHAFEPDAENFKKLKSNCDLNKLNNVILNKVALSDKNGSLSFTKMLDGENHISLSESAETVKVDALTFDTYCENNKLEKLSYVKVDIEGFELFFLKGAHSLLQKKKIEIIQLELNSQVKNSFTQVSEVLDILHESGYILCAYDVEKKRLSKINYTDNRENYFAVSDVDLINQKLNN